VRSILNRSRAHDGVRFVPAAGGGDIDEVTIARDLSRGG
jgi:hypothetical protein